MNISLIGMPGVGKTSLGGALAKHLNFHYIDTDDLILSSRPGGLQTIIESCGEEQFLKMEEEVILSLSKDMNRHVISTGGSVIYSQRNMTHLSELSHIVLLRGSYQQIKNRIKNQASRGIAGLMGKTFRELFEEREPLYRRYAHTIIDLSTLRSAKDIHLLLKAKGVVN